jgi:CheY-like chemotaxis protein
MKVKRVLVIDDNPVILKSVAMMLKPGGYEVAVAEGGASAACAVRHQPPDLLIVDVHFDPDVGNGGGVSWDGFLIVEWLRRMDEIKDLPFIVISLDDSLATRQRAAAAGATAFLRKPIRRGELLDAVQHAFQTVPATCLEVPEVATCAHS